MENNSNDVIEIDLLKMAKAIWRKIWLVILAVVICGGIGFSYAAFALKPEYQADVMIYVNCGSLSIGGGKISVSDLSAAKSLVDTYLVILKTRTTLNEVAMRASVDYDYQQLSDMITAGSVNGTEVFRVTVTSHDPAEAARIANTISAVLPDKISDVVDGSSARTVDFAVQPTQKSGPSIVKYTAIGVLIGLLLSCGFVVVTELMDDQVHSGDDLVEAYGVPILAEIPDLLPQKKEKGIGYKGAGRYAYYEGYGDRQDEKQREKQ